MKIKDFKLIENYMLTCMQDSAHDKEHIYRVLYTALDIADHETDVDYDVLITACLLHDIGRQEQYDNPSICHAAAGAEKARIFLIENGFPHQFTEAVCSCIKAHRFRSENPPKTLEEKILFDSDKLDVTGTLGIARTLLYQGKVGEPLYFLNESGEVSDGTADKSPSFFHEYKKKSEGLYNNFYTARGRELALLRQKSAVAFYESLLEETRQSYEYGLHEISKHLQ